LLLAGSATHMMLEGQLLIPHRPASRASAASEEPNTQAPIRIRNLKDLIRQIDESITYRNASPSGSDDLPLPDQEAERLYRGMDGSEDSHR